MSASAAWSHTSQATLWPFISRDDWSGVVTYGAPIVFSCDYKSESKIAVDDLGVEFITGQVMYTEYDIAKFGDRVLIGNHLDKTDPILAGALEVRLIGRYSDTFERVADDYKIMTDGVTSYAFTPSTGYKITIEDGFRLLLESGDAILLEA